MRFREVKDRESRTRWLEASLGRRDQIDWSLASWLENFRDESLLEFRPVGCRLHRRPREDGGPVRDEVSEAEPKLLYDVTGLKSLPELFRTDAVSRQQYESLLFSVADLSSMLDRTGCPLYAVDFDRRHVFSTDEGVLRFAVLPLVQRDRLLGRRTDMRDLLLYLSTGRGIRFISDEDVSRAERLARLASGRGQFDTAAYRDFLEKEYGVLPGAWPLFHAGRGREAHGVGSDQRPREVPRTILMGSAVVDEGVGGDRYEATPAPRPDAVVESPTGESAAGSQNDGAQSDDFRHRSEAPAEDMDTTCWLVREKTGERYPLDEGVEDVLGRSPSCDVQILGNLSLSRMHASVVCEEGGVEIFDLGSENGVVVRGELLAENDHEVLGYGERFLLADEPFHVERAGQS